MVSSFNTLPSSHTSFAPTSLVPPEGRIGPQIPTQWQLSTLAFSPLVPTVGEAAKQWHLSMLGDMDAVWADYTGKGVHVGVYDSGTQRNHWDIDANYDGGRHVVVDGKTYDGDWDAQSDDVAHGTAVAGIIAAERNGRGGVGISYDAAITGVNIFNRYSEDGAKAGIYINAADPGKFLQAFDQATRFDIVNHSWGSNGEYSSDYSRGVDGTIFHYLATSMANAAATGRGGLGTIAVTASGNGSTLFFGAAHDQSDSWKSDRHVITVGAYRGDNGSAAFYSFGGPHLLVSAPSGDFSHLGNPKEIFTTDVTSYWGYNTKARPGGKEDYTDTFSGTSAATPVVTGVVALMLDANKRLGWRDVSDILAASAKMPVAFDTKQTIVESTADVGGMIFFEKGGRYTLNNSTFKLGGADADWNGGRMHYSTDYGYGAVDAYAAVRMAEVWGLFGAARTSANEVSVDTGMMTTDIVVPASYPALESGVVYHDFVGNKFAGSDQPRFSFQVDDGIKAEHVDLTLAVHTTVPFYIENPDTGEYELAEVTTSMLGLRFKVIAPDGTEMFMDTYGKAMTDADGAQLFNFGFAGFRGAGSAGTWTIEFENLSGEYQSNITIEGVRIQAFGSPETNDDVHTYTDEFFTMAAIQGEAGRRVLVDTDDGFDWINAAAVSKDVVLSLVGGQSTSFDGTRAFTIGRSSVIENAVTGDGDDTLVGNRFDNLLVAMRGNDTLNGGNGNDWLIGGAGNDRFLFDNKGTSGKDLVLDFNRGDMIGTQTALRGSGADGKITVAANTLLLLDGTRFGDTAQLSEQDGAVIQAQGQKDGYFWYSFVSGTDIKPDDVIREGSFQPETTAAGSVDAVVALSPVHGMADDVSGSPGAVTSSAVGEHGSFYLYDAMAGSMSGGVLLHA